MECGLAGLHSEKICLQELHLVIMLPARASLRGQGGFAHPKAPLTRSLPHKYSRWLKVTKLPSSKHPRQKPQSGHAVLRVLALPEATEVRIGSPSRPAQFDDLVRVTTSANRQEVRGLVTQIFFLNWIV